jgi:hypothetical protein
MIFQLYVIGICLCLLWFLYAAFLIFDKSNYEKSFDEVKKSIDDMHSVLFNMYPNNPQLAYFLFSIFISMFWPIMIPYIIIISKKD